MIKPEEIDVIIVLLEKNGENPKLLEKLKTIQELNKASEESRKKITELQAKLQEM